MLLALRHYCPNGLLPNIMQQETIFSLVRCTTDSQPIPSCWLTWIALSSFLGSLK
jgi:hypothetical protein